MEESQVPVIADILLENETVVETKARIGTGRKSCLSLP
jgi:hypothetical protein